MKITVQGVEHPVAVDAAGVFSVTVDGTAYEADTLAGLKHKVAARRRRTPVKVEVPFTIIDNGMIRHGVAWGIDDTHILVRWEDGGGLAELITWHHAPTLERLGEQDADAYRNLNAAREAAAHAVERFERSRAINLKDVILAAIAAQETEGGNP